MVHTISRTLFDDDIITVEQKNGDGIVITVFNNGRYSGAYLIKLNPDNSIEGVEALD